MRFIVMGGFEVRDDQGMDCSPASPKLRALLALLAVDAERVLPAQHLIETLWDYEIPRTASTALQVYISKLRQHFDAIGIGREAIATRPAGYLLSLAGHQLDLFEFDRLVADARRLSADEPHEAMDRLGRALALCPGPSLGDLRSHGKLDIIARQLDGRRLRAHELHCDLAFRVGRESEIICDLYRLAAERPTDESVRWYLMAALYRNGSVADALDVYRDLREAMVERLAMEPGERLTRLYVDIIGRASWLDGAGGLATARR
ncbi:BTAD domain-containing putative transcriptional regulator [Catellatospora bangladeshensis]|nr:AfsR/SARP family transcriptional regulator [Catellatospora bangladeshensis]